MGQQETVVRDKGWGRGQQETATHDGDPRQQQRRQLQEMTGGYCSSKHKQEMAGGGTSRGDNRGG